MNCHRRESLRLRRSCRHCCNLRHESRCSCFRCCNFRYYHCCNCCYAMMNAMSCLKMMTKNVMTLKNSSSPAAGDMPYREKMTDLKCCLPAYAMSSFRCCSYRRVKSLNYLRDMKYHFRVMLSCHCYSLCRLCHAMMNYRWCSRCHAM